MRRAFETATIKSALDMALQEIYEMADSMQEAADNMPEQLNTLHAKAAVRLQIGLDFLYSSDPPAGLCEHEVTWVQWCGRKLFRPQRRDNVVNFLRAYLAAVPQGEDLERLRSNLQLGIDVLADVYFPGMSGRRRAA